MYTIENVKEDNQEYDINVDTQANANDYEYSKIFKKDEIQNVNIKIVSDNWNYLMENALDKPTVLVNSFSIGDEEIEYVSIKTKGNSSLDAVNRQGSNRYSFLINFGKYITTSNGYSEKQNFYGLKKISLGNIYGDSSLMKEYLSYELMKEMGVYTPEYCLINLKFEIVDDYGNIQTEIDYGVYMMVESIETSLTERTLNEKSDCLTKPEQYGGELLYDSVLDEFINENGEFDFLTILYDESGELIYPNDASNPLYLYSGLWEYEEDTFEDIVEMLPTIFKWMKKLNELNVSEDPNTEEYRDELEAIIDVDNLIRYFATNTYLVNLDSYISSRAHNYGLYISENGKATIFPWDFNYSFGSFEIGSNEEMINYNIYNIGYVSDFSERPLINVILQNDYYKELYKTYLKDCCIIASLGGTTSEGKFFNKNNFINILDRYQNEYGLEELYSVETDVNYFFTVQEYMNETNNLKELIICRSQSVIEQLNDNLVTE